MNIKPTRSERFVLTLVAAIILYQLIVPPSVGIADNGDFARIAVKEDLMYLTSSRENVFEYVVTKYKFDPGNRRYDPGFISSENVLLHVAVLLNRLVSKDGLFDVRVLGIVQTCFFLLGIWLILVASRMLTRPLRIVLISLLVLIFTDVGYVSYFNSLYSESASLIFYCLLVGVIWLLIGVEKGNAWLLVSYFVIAALLVSAKPQNFVAGVPLALFGIRLSQTRSYGYWKHIGVGLALALCFFSIWYYFSTPTSIRNANKYNVVFLEILKNAPSPEEALSDLGLKSDLIKYVGTDAFMPNAPMNDPSFKRSFFDQIGDLTIPKYYLTHPGRFFELANRGAYWAFYLRTFWGNFERSTNMVHNSQSQAFAQWSRFRWRYVPKSIWFLLGCLGASIVILIFKYKRCSASRDKLLLEFFTLLVLMAMGQFFVATLGETVGEVKHWYLFSALFDTCLIMAALWITSKGLAPAIRRVTRRVSYHKSISHAL